MTAASSTDHGPTAAQRAYRDRVAGGARHAEGSQLLADVIAAGPYHSDDPVHHAAVDADTLRCEVHALAETQPRLRLVAEQLDVVAGELDSYAEAAGL